MLPYTFVRIFLFFVAGSLTGIFFPTLFSWEWIVPSLSFSCFLYLILFIIQRYRPSLAVGWLAMIIFFLSGVLSTYLRTEPNSPDHISHFRDRIEYYEVVVADYPEEKENSWKVVSEIRKARFDGKWEDVTGKVLLHWNKNTFSDPVYGQLLLIKGSPSEILKPLNPNEFDYRKFLSYKNIYNQDFIKDSTQAFIIGYKPSNYWIALTYSFRSQCYKILRRNISGDQELAIVSALVLGVKDGVDEELGQAFAASGAMHVLAVSGLHIGVLYWVLLFFLKPLRHTYNGRWVIAISSLAFLWTYAFLTGLSPSVMRAAIMFSVMALALPGSLSNNIYNVLGISACVLLLWDPFIIMSVGFQLSFLAVLGIVYFYPKLNLLLAPTSWWGSQLWKLTSVSIAAQLSTFALGLLYFHQFPTYFLLSNIFVIPLAFIVLAGGFLLIALFWIPGLVSVLAWLTNGAAMLLNYGVKTVERMPFSLITDVYLTTTQCWMIMLWVLALVFLLEFKKFYLLYGCLAISLMFTFVKWQDYIESRARKQFIVYRIPNTTLIDFQEAGRILYFVGRREYEDPNVIDFHTHSFRLSQYVDRAEDIHIHHLVRDINGCRLIRWNDISILIVDNPDFHFSAECPVDFLIVCNNAIWNIDNLKSVNYKQLIADSSNSWSCVEKLSREAIELNKPFYSVLHSGAYVFTL